jgi:hypothetical protein
MAYINHRTAARLVQRAQPAHHSELAATDMLALISGAALATDVAHARRLVALLCTALLFWPAQLSMA